MQLPFGFPTEVSGCFCLGPMSMALGIDSDIALALALALTMTKPNEAGRPRVSEEERGLRADYPYSPSPT